MKQIILSLVDTEVSYDPATGLFRWLISKRGHRRAGDIAGSVNGQGYWRVKINQVTYLGHRLAWAMFYGEDPGNMEVDHINGDPLDNRIGNLRLADRVQNARNVKGDGVFYDSGRGKWQARLGVNYKTIHLGRYATRDEAVAAVKAAKIIHFGDFARG